MDTDLIKLVNKLQDTFSNLGGELDLPQIVVVGSQSAGKSSVLETIVGKDFLPRGQGIVTRRPLVLQLIHTPLDPEPTTSPSSPKDPRPASEWATFLHIDKKFTDFADVRKEIEQETFRVAGQNKGISKLPISLRIHSPHVLDLTLVDLPGLTKIPVGDQPSDIERQIRNLVLEYISNPNSVILAVSPANVDLANSDSLKLARSVDPRGLRTIGVLTKLDLMDAGTNALDILTGRVYPLKLGFIGVVNRSQQDIMDEKSMGDARSHEEEFFRRHNAYRTIAHKNGTAYLARTLNQVLMNHIRDKLPDMKARLNTLMGQAQQELNSFGDSATFGDKNLQGALILRLMTQFARDFVSSIEGTSMSNFSTKELSGGARIYYIFNDVYGSALGTIDVNSSLTLSDADIRTAIRNSTGPRPSLFVPEGAFELLVKPLIGMLAGPSLRCVEMVYEELVKICHNCTSLELQRFPRLHAQLIEVVSELLRERLGPTSDYTQSLIDIQKAYINVNHPTFVGSIGGSAGVFAGNGQERGITQPPPSRALIPQRPASAEPLNTPGALGEEEDIDDDALSQHSDIFPPRDGSRSVSSTVHDRSRTTVHTASHHHHHHSSGSNSATTKAKQITRKTQASVGQNGTPPGAGGARETFLHYFFGRDGASGAGVSASPSPGHDAIVPTGRDMGPVGGLSGIDTGLLASKAGISAAGGVGASNGDAGTNNVAFEMKSLGKHIEAIPLTPGHPSSRDSLETSLIRSLINSYFSLVRQQIQDLVPKAVMHLLVNHTCQSVQNRLVASLYKPELFGEMLSEDEGLVAERARVKGLLDAYKEAFRVLSDVGVKGPGS